MHMTRLIVFVSLGMVVLSVGGCAKNPTGDDRVIATVSSQPITLRQFNTKIAKLPPYYKSIVEKNRKLYLDDMIIEQLLYEEAVRKGVNRDREVVDLLNEAKRKIFIAKYIKNEVDDKIRISELEMKEFYDSNRDDFKTPPLWRASHILVGSEDQARTLRDEIAKGASFEELAKKYSIDATASRGGDVGYFRMGQLIPEFEKVCLKLNKGEISDILHTQFGYHIIKLTDKREPVAESYDKVRPAIEGELRKKKREVVMNKLVADLKNRYSVIVDKDLFASDRPAGEDAKKTESGAEAAGR